jgi:hypothetical protein
MDETEETKVVQLSELINVKNNEISTLQNEIEEIKIKNHTKELNDYKSFYDYIMNNLDNLSKDEILKFDQNLLNIKNQNNDNSLNNINNLSNIKVDEDIDEWD